MVVIKDKVKENKVEEVKMRKGPENQHCPLELREGQFGSSYLYHVHGFGILVLYVLLETAHQNLAVDIHGLA